MFKVHNVKLREAINDNDLRLNVLRTIANGCKDPDAVDQSAEEMYLEWTEKKRWYHGFRKHKVDELRIPLKTVRCDKSGHQNCACRNNADLFSEIARIALYFYDKKLGVDIECKRIYDDYGGHSYNLILTKCTDGGTDGDRICPQLYVRYEYHEDIAQYTIRKYDRALTDYETWHSTTKHNLQEQKETRDYVRGNVAEPHRSRLLLQLDENIKRLTEKEPMIRHKLADDPFFPIVLNHLGV